MDKKELVNKIRYLLSKKNHDQAYAIIREFEKNNNYKMICVSAQGFINAYHYRAALKILESIKEKGLEDLSEISNDFFSKTIDDWIKKAKFWGAFRIEENKYKEEL